MVFVCSHAQKLARPHWEVHEHAVLLSIRYRPSISIGPTCSSSSRHSPHQQHRHCRPPHHELISLLLRCCFLSMSRPTTWRHRVVRKRMHNGHKGLVVSSKVTLAQQEQDNFRPACNYLDVRRIVASPNESCPSHWAWPWTPKVVVAGRRRRRSRCRKC
jgi:hypothetical protein